MKSKITKYINIVLFYKIYNPLRFICFSIVNNCKPLPINKEFLNTEYKVFISKNNNEIYKILRKDSFWSWVIANEIKTQKGYENLKSLLEEYPVEYSKVKEVQTSLVNTFENMLSKL